MDEITIEELHDPGDGEIAGLAELIARTTEHDHHRPIGEHALVELKQGPQTFPHAAFVARAGDALAGYAHLSERETRTGWRLEVFVAPEHRGRAIGQRLVGSVIDHVAEHGGGMMHLWAYRPAEAVERTAARFGMRRIRTLCRMTRALPGPDVEPPDGVMLRPFTERDATRWLALHNEAFAEHPDAGGWTDKDLRWHLDEPWFDPDAFVLAEREDALVGYCWMKVEDDEGWIYFLGVSPKARGTGLAGALASAGMRAAHDAGATRALLYVDSDNVPALRLYERLGFATDHHDVCFLVEVPPRER